MRLDRAMAHVAREQQAEIADKVTKAVAGVALAAGGIAIVCGRIVVWLCSPILGPLVWLWAYRRDYNNRQRIIEAATRGEIRGQALKALQHRAYLFPRSKLYNGADRVNAKAKKLKRQHQLRRLRGASLEDREEQEPIVLSAEIQPEQKE